MSELTKISVAQKVQQYLTGREFDGITLEVVESGVTKVDGWWRVPVRPNVWPKTIAAYYEALANVESEIDEKEGLNILLSSGQPAEAEEVSVV